MDCEESNTVSLQQALHLSRFSSLFIQSMHLDGTFLQTICFNSSNFTMRIDVASIYFGE